MNAKILAKIAVASTFYVPSCFAEQGVVIDKQDLPDEKALYVNLIQSDTSKQKPLFVPDNGIYDADRKLFFTDSTYLEPFVYALPGDTIVFNNPLHRTYIQMQRNKYRIRRINGLDECDIMKFVRSSRGRQK